MAKRNKEDRMATPLVTPECEVLYSNLQTPDRFDPGEGLPIREEYRIQLKVEDTPEWENFLQKLVDFQNARARANGKDDDATKPSCVKSMQYGPNKEKVRFIRAHSKSRDYFEVVDKTNKRTPDEPWGGSRVRVAVYPEYYASFGGGLTLYLCKVMIVENSNIPSTENRITFDPFSGIADDSMPDEENIPF